jgi:hypothetical protein
MIAGPPCPRGRCPTEPKPRLIQFSDEKINDTDTGLLTFISTG